LCHKEPLNPLEFHVMPLKEKTQIFTTFGCRFGCDSRNRLIIKWYCGGRGYRTYIK